MTQLRLTLLSESWDWVELLKPLVSDGWALAAFFLGTTIWLGKRLMSKSDSVEKERDRYLDVLLGRLPNNSPENAQIEGSDD